MVLAFSHLQHECQDLLSPWDGWDLGGVYSHLNAVESGVRTCLSTRENPFSNQVQT